MTEKEIKAIDCIAQHIGTFLNQASNRRAADFAEPCEKCKLDADCNFDWLEIMIPILKYGTNQKAISLGVSKDKQGNVHIRPYGSNHQHKDTHN